MGTNLRPTARSICPEDGAQSYGPTMKPSYRKLTKGLIDNHLAPYFGERDLRGLREADLLTYVQAKLDEGLGRVEETVKKFLSFTPRRVEPRPTDLADVARKAIGLACASGPRRSPPTLWMRSGPPSVCCTRTPPRPICGA